MAPPLPQKPSIAVLPFANMSDDPKQEYFADGMTDDLITDLSKISGLFVISRNSTAVYKHKDAPPKQVSEELGVRYVLEGSIQRAGDKLRINAQLIDALSGGHIWADRFDGSLADVFALQDEVTRGIADALALRLTDAQQQSDSQQETSVPGAYDAFLRGWEHYRRTTPEDYAQAIPYFEEAIKQDPNYGRAYAALAMIYIRSSERHWAGSLGMTGAEAYAKGQEYLTDAKKVPTALAHQVAGIVLLGHTEQMISNYLRNAAPMSALAEFKEALALDPGDSWNYMHVALALTSLGRSTEAIAYMTTAMRLDPHPPAIFMYYLGLAQFNLEKFEAAAQSLESATRLNSDNQYPFLLLAATDGYLGRKEEAESAIAHVNKLVVQQGYFPVTIYTTGRLYLFQKADLERFRKGLRLAGVPDFLSGSSFATRNRLTTDETRSLFFGHRLHGRDLDTGIEWDASTTADGDVTSTGIWGSIDHGTIGFDGDQVCFTKSSTVRFCGRVYRNPGGTKTKQNEFIWDSVRGIRPFSQVE
jgi:TolB-like protein/Tfp pilus assembly protein PilF